jgi:hypothetical protein
MTKACYCRNGADRSKGEFRRLLSRPEFGIGGAFTVVSPRVRDVIEEPGAISSSRST